jgi:hypothetical protein
MHRSGSRSCSATAQEGTETGAEMARPGRGRSFTYGLYATTSVAVGAVEATADTGGTAAALDGIAGLDDELDGAADGAAGVAAGRLDVPHPAIITTASAVAPRHVKRGVQ